MELLETLVLHYSYLESCSLNVKNTFDEPTQTDSILDKFTRGCKQLTSLL